MPATSPDNLRYPLSTDTPNVPRDLEFLATDVQAALASVGTDAIPETLLTAKGQIIGASASAIPAAIPAGTDGQFLIADSSVAAGAKFSTTSPGNLELESATSFMPSVQVTNTTDDAQPPFFNLRKSRAGAIVQSGDSVGSIAWRAFNGTSYNSLSQIRAVVDGTPGPTGDMPGRLEFYTSADGTSTVTERMRIDNSGRVKLPAGGILEAPLTQNAQVDSYTLVLADAGKLVEMGKATVQTLTIPTNGTVAFPVGTKIDILQTGAGQVTVAGAVGVTVNATPGLKISAQWGAATLIKRATNTWVLVGSLAA